MCKDELNRELVDLDQKLEQGLMPISIGGEIVIIDLSGYSEYEIEEMDNLWGENSHGTLQQGATYKGIPFESESEPKPFCPVRSASGG